MLYVHRLFGLLAALFVLYIGVTGSTLQSVDLVTLLGHAPASDANLRAMREHIDGPQNYAVITTADYTAGALPENFDYATALTRLTAAAHAAAPGAAVRLVEFRVTDGRPAGHVQLDREQLMFDANDARAMPTADIPKDDPEIGERSLRNQIKSLHKAQFIGRIGPVINAIAGIALSVLVFTGLVHYFRLLRARRKIRRPALFWQSGGWWRSLHRWCSLAAALFIGYVTISGLLLTIDCLAQAYNIAAGERHHINAHDINRDVSSPMSDEELPAMLRTTLASYRSALPAVPIKVLRLRYFSGIPQGVVIADDADTTQLVFNTHSGQRVSETEPGYPNTGFLLGWQGHETLKRIHRGDYLGMGGQWMEFIAGLSIVFLGISGLKMYYDLWRRRQKAGRHGLFWH